MLDRLLAHRGVTLDGPPTVPMLRELAPKLGLHAADLIVIAGLELPRDLIPAAPTPPYDVGHLVREAAAMVPQLRRRVAYLVRRMPVVEPDWPPPVPEYPLGLLLGLLRNRNIKPRNAKLLMYVGSGPYVSDSTYYGLGDGRVRLTPQYVSAFAAVLGIPAADLAAMTGVPPADRMAVRHPHRAELAALAWDARRLTGEQIAEVLRTVDRRAVDRRQFCMNCLQFHVSTDLARRRTAPADVIWRLVDGRAVPVSRRAGPREWAGSRAFRFEDSSDGAVIAAVHLAPAFPDGWTLVGYRVAHYAEVARIELVLEAADHTTLGGLTVSLIWRAGDWHLVPPDPETPEAGLRPITSLDEFVREPGSRPVGGEFVPWRAALP